MYAADHPDIDMFGYPAVLRMPAPMSGFMKLLPGVGRFLDNHLTAFYMDQVIMEIDDEEEEAFKKDPEVWVEVYDWEGEEETRIRVGPEWTEEDILGALADYGVKPHPVLSRVFGFMQYVGTKTLEAKRSLEHVEKRLLDPEGVLTDEEGESLLQWRDFLTQSVSTGEAVVFDTFNGEYAPWSALDRLRFYKENRKEVDEVISQLEALALEAEEQTLQEEEEEEALMEEEDSVSSDSYEEQEEGTDDAEDEGGDEYESDEDIAAYLDDGEILV